MSHLFASLPNNLADPFPHQSLQNFVAVIRNPLDVGPVENGVSAEYEYRATFSSGFWSHTASADFKIRERRSLSGSLNRTGWKPVVYLQ